MNKLDQRTIEALAEDIHNATPVETDGGVPDVCNRYAEHWALAEKLVGAGWVRLGARMPVRQAPAAVTVADGTVGMRRGV